MPTYVFECPACQRQVEKVLSIATRDLVITCPGGRGMGHVHPPRIMSRIITPVVGIVRKPAAGPRRG